jgi:hypothetical protein
LFVLDIQSPKSFRKRFKAYFPFKLPPFPSSMLSRFFPPLSSPTQQLLHFSLHAAAAPAADKVEFPPLYFPPLFHSFFPATVFPAQKLHALLLHALFTAPRTALARAFPL